MSSLALRLAFGMYRNLSTNCRPEVFNDSNLLNDSNGRPIPIGIDRLKSNLLLKISMAESI